MPDQRRNRITPWYTHRWKSHHGHSAYKERKWIGRDRIRRSITTDFEIAKHAVEECCVRERQCITRVGRRRAFNVRAGFMPIPSQIQLELPPEHVHQWQIWRMSSGGEQCGFGLTRRFNGRNVLIHTKPDETSSSNAVGSRGTSSTVRWGAMR